MHKPSDCPRVPLYVKYTSYQHYLFSNTKFQVEIGLLHDLPHANSVGTEPLTSDDWEIIVRQTNPHDQILSTQHL